MGYLAKERKNLDLDMPFDHWSVLVIEKLIEKSQKDGHTFTNVTALGYNERINEIARIMSGTEITENLYNSAKELIDRSILQ